MRTTDNTIFLSDLLACPRPQKATSPQDYRRKLRNRLFLWALLPWLLEAAAIVVTLMLLVAGITVCSIGLGR